MCFNSVTHQITLAAGLGIVIYAGLASGADWKEYYQYFNESKFVSHSTINTYFLDIVLVSPLFEKYGYRSYLELRNYTKRTTFGTLMMQIHVMSLDFTLLSAFAPFWVYNDMTSRKW